MSHVVTKNILPVNVAAQHSVAQKSACEMGLEVPNGFHQIDIVCSFKCELSRADEMSQTPLKRRRVGGRNYEASVSVFTAAYPQNRIYSSMQSLLWSVRTPHSMAIYKLNSLLTTFLSCCHHEV